LVKEGCFFTPLHLGAQAIEIAYPLETHFIPLMRAKKTGPRALAAVSVLQLSLWL
jgi:hypothetical protein